MFSTDLNGAEGYVVALLGLVAPLLGLLLTYVVIRLAVKHGVRSALAERDLRRDLAEADRILAE